MVNQKQFAAAVLAALAMGAMIGCGQKREIQQYVPDNMIEFAETTAVTTSASLAEYTETSVSMNSMVSGSESSVSTTSGTTTTGKKTSVHYAGNPNMTVRRTAAVTTAPPVITTRRTTVTTVPVITTAATTTTAALITESAASETTTESTTVTTNIELIMGTVTEGDLQLTVKDTVIALGADVTDFYNIMLNQGSNVQDVDADAALGAAPFGYSFDDKLQLFGDGTTIKKMVFTSTEMTTAKGIGIGATMDDVVAAYGTGYAAYIDAEGRTVYSYTLNTNQLEFTFDDTLTVCAVQYYMH